MKKNNNEKMLKRELKDKLDWYTMYASEKEYDEKAVESILYLLDHIEPLEEGSVPPSEEAWERFLKRKENARELLPLNGKEAAALREEIRRLGRNENSVVSKNESGVAGRNESSVASKNESGVASRNKGSIVDRNERGIGGRNESSVAGRNASGVIGRNESSVVDRNESCVAGRYETGYEDGIRVFASGGESAVASNAIGNSRAEMAEDSGLHFRLGGKAMGAKRKDSVLPGKKGKIAGFMLRYKAAAAVLLMVTAVAVGGSLQAGAVKNDGFFFWLKRDETGTEMITSPEGLNGEASETGSNIFYDSNDMPEWTCGWLKIEDEFEMPENYEWQYYEIKELDFIKSVNVHYSDQNLKKEIILGVYVYAENVFYNRDRFANYDYVDSYESDQKQMDIYSKTEDNGEIFYTICFYEGNCRYSIRGEEGLEGLKGLANRYWGCVKNNL